MSLDACFRGMAVGAFIALVLSGCAGATETVPDADEPEADTQTDALRTWGCDQGRLIAEASADSPERGAALRRAYVWVNKKVPYSQTSYFEGYRTDCSGFVSMAWGLPKPGVSTYNLAPYFETRAQEPWKEDQLRDATHELNSFQSLRPGDVLNSYNPSAKHGHVLLFAGWADSGKQTACVLEEKGIAYGTQANAYPWASLKAAYHRVRHID